MPPSSNFPPGKRATKSKLDTPNQTPPTLLVLKMSDDEASSIHTPIMTQHPSQVSSASRHRPQQASNGVDDLSSHATHPHHFTDLPVIPEDYLFELEDRYPALATATRALFYVRNPANSQAVAKRERRRMRLFLPPLRDTIEATYKSAFWAAYNADNSAIPIRQVVPSDLMFVM